MKFVFTLASSFLIFHAFATPVDSVRAVQREEGLFVVHEVEEQETLYSIARRYNGSVGEIIKHNQIVDNTIDIGQLLYVLVDVEKPVAVQVIELPEEKLKGAIHKVQPGETLYSISKLYDVSLNDLKVWNGLPNNDLSIGMQLKVNKDAVLIESDELKGENVESGEEENRRDSLASEERDPFEGFEKYLVQTGETITSISNKIGISIDSLKSWNDLKNDYLRIGQELFYKGSVQSEELKLVEPKKNKRSQIDAKGFERIYEEGVASVIESMKTSRFLALHRTLPIGTNLEVRNLMNNQKVHVKVVGRLPDTGLNENLFLRISQPAYDQLGILDSKSRVEVSYYKQ